MTKKAKYSMLILVWGIVMIQTMINVRQAKEKEMVLDAMAPVEGTLHEQVTGYCNLGERELVESVKTNMLKQFGKELSLTDQELKKETINYMETWEINGNTKQGTVCIRLVSVGKDLAPQQYLWVESTQQIASASTDSMYWSIGHLFQENNLKGKVMVEQSMEKTGYQLASVEEIAHSFFDPLSATVVDEIRENGICTIYGYTKKETSFFVQNGSRVNVQLVLFYDRDLDKTIVKLGIPLVNSLY